MSTMKLETERLFLRSFTENDIAALHLLLKDEEVNTFLPWFPSKTLEETMDFYRKRIVGQKYYFAICQKEKNVPVGYINTDLNDSHGFGYALRREYWHRGIVTEAGHALIYQLRKDGIPYITATHDRKNPRSGGVMQNLGMNYCYSYKEQWQPKNFPVIFRMYQLNLDGQKDRIYTKYWDRYPVHFVEKNL